MYQIVKAAPWEVSREDEHNFRDSLIMDKKTEKFASNKGKLVVLTYEDAKQIVNKLNKGE